MGSGVTTARASQLAVRIRTWWEKRAFLGDVALAFTVITVVNSVMMLVGWDEPKDGSFAYTHLLGRLGLVATVIGLFYLGELREGVLAWRADPARSASRRRLSARASVPRILLEAVARAPVDSMAIAFTAIVGLGCLATLGGVRVGVYAPAGGPSLYRALLVLAAMLLLLVAVVSQVSRRGRGLDAQ
jgi:hypothetical protein